MAEMRGVYAIVYGESSEEETMTIADVFQFEHS